MYIIRKDKKRTSKQLFGLLKDRLLEHLHSQPKTKPPAIPNHDKIFPQTEQFYTKQADDNKPDQANNDRIFKQFGETAITVSDLQNRPYKRYGFPLSTYGIRMSDSSLQVVQTNPLMNVTHPVYGKILCVSSHKQYLLGGCSTGYLLVWHNPTCSSRKIYFRQLGAPNHQIVAVSMSDSKGIVAADQTGNCYYMEIVKDQLKLLCNFSTGAPVYCFLMLQKSLSPSLSEKIILVSDSTGCIFRVLIKSWLMLTSAETKLLHKEKTGLAILRQMNRQIQTKHLKAWSLGEQASAGRSVLLAAANSRYCQIMVYNFELDTLEKLYTISNMNTQITDKPTFAAQFIEGVLSETSTETAVLACSFDDKVYFVSIKQTKVQVVTANKLETKAKLVFATSKRMKSPEWITHIEWMGAGRFIMISKNLTIYYCLVRKTVYLQKFMNLTEINPLTFANPDCSVRTLQIPESSRINLYINSIVRHGSSHFIILGGRELMISKILSSIELLNQIRESEALELMAYLILLHNTDSPYLDKIPESELLGIDFPDDTPQCKQLILEYFYLIKQEPPNFPELNELLVPFIFAHKLTNLSDQQTESLVQYWTRENEHVVEQIILSGINKGWETAIKHARMRPLVKMVQMGAEYDFPILKLYGYVVLHRNDPDKTVFYKYISQIIKYLSLGINRQLKNNVSNSEYQSMIQFFIRVLYENSLFEQLAQAKPKKLVKMLTGLFSGESKQAIDSMELQPYILNCNRQYKYMQHINASVSEILYSHSIQTVCGLSSDNADVQRAIDLHQCILLHGYEFNFTKERCFEILNNLMSEWEINSIMLIEYFRQKKHIKQQIEGGGEVSQPLLAEDVTLEQVEQLDVQEFLLSLVDQLSELFCFDNSEKTQLLELTDQSENLELVNVSLQSPSKFDSIISKYLSSKNKLIRQKVFDWLETTVKVLRSSLLDPNTPSPELEAFTRAGLSRIKDLIVINKQRTRNFIRNYYQNSEKKLVNRIESYPQLQLEYVELILKETQQEADEDLLTLHMSLLCKLDSSRIIEVLEAAQNNQFLNYNFEGVLNLALEYKLNNVVIYIYEKTGDLVKALNEHLRIFLSEWEKYKQEKTMKAANNLLKVKRTFTMDDLKSIKNKKDREESCEQIVRNHMEYLIDMIHKHPKIPPYYDLYSTLINFLMKIYEYEEYETQQKRGIPGCLNTISNLIGNVIVDLVKENNLVFLMSQILTKYTQVNFREMKRSFLESFKHLSDSRTLLANIQEINKDFLLRLNHEVRHFILSSVSVEPICSICSRGMSGDCLVFDCGHSFHLGCTIEQNSNDYCAQCVFTDPAKAIIDFPDIQLVDFLTQRQRKLQKMVSNMNGDQKDQNKEGISNEKRKKEKKDREEGELTMSQKRLMNRMKIYDKKEQDARDGVEVIELKLELSKFENSS